MRSWELVDFVQNGGKSLSTLLAKLAAERGENPALLASRGAARSFARFESQIRSIGNLLALRGLAGDSRVAIILPDSADAAVVTMGVMAHAVALPMNPRNPPEEMVRNLLTLGAASVITSAGIQGENIRRVANELSLPAFTVIPDREDNSEMLVTEDSAALRSSAKTVTPRGGDDIAMIVRTSGTTGRAKIVPLSHNNLLSMMLANCQVLELTPQERCLSIMPLYHIHGLGAVLCSILSGGSVVVSEGGFAVDPFFDLLNEFGATWYTAVPTIHRAILERAPAHIPQIAAIAARGGLRFVRSGSAPMPAGIPARLESLFHTIYIEASGATEASAYICSNRPGQRRIGSVGLPMPGTEVRILDESLKPVGTGVTGELVARGPGIFRGYEGDTENHCFADGFFRTGDLGHVDADGFFYITGRIKEQINRAGLKISPGEVDEVLLRHPAVAEAVTFAISDDRLGQEIAAAIVLRNAATTTDLDIQRFASQYLADYKVPRRIVFVHDIPKTASGKVLRIDLVRQLNLDGTTANNNGTEPRTVTGLNKPITPLEQAVAVIFSEVLNRPVWDINAPLHALGADSLQALNICLALENRFGRSIPLAALTVHPSIRGISDLLSGDAVAFPPGSPITLREGTSGGPLLFVFPGVGGNIYSYHGLVRQLPKEWRVIGIPLPGADGLEEPLSSMDALADRFLKTIEPALRTHRCFLLGYSFGGKLAFEVAHRLSDSGLQPPTLILCDTPAPGWPPKLTWGKKLKSYVVRAREDGMMAAFRQLFDRKFSAGPGAVVSSSEEESASESSGRAAGIQKEVERRLLEASRAAIQNWRTSPAALHIYLLRASEMLWRAYDRSDSHMGWEDIALGGVHASAIPGKHVTIFDEVNVRAMAERTIGIVNEVLSTSPEVQPDRPMILSSALST